jgi:MFS family permease
VFRACRDHRQAAGFIFVALLMAMFLLGGFFVDHTSRRWVFSISLPLGVVALAVVAAVLHTLGVCTGHRIDYLSALVISPAITCVVLVTSPAAPPTRDCSKPVDTDSASVCQVIKFSTC